VYITLIYDVKLISTYKIQCFNNSPNNGAVDFVNEGFGGPKAAVKSGKFPGIDHQAVTRRLKGTVVNGAEEDSRSLLSFTEERELALYGSQML
jgi:hypothetical protein